MERGSAGSVALAYRLHCATTMRDYIQTAVLAMCAGCATTSDVSTQTDELGATVLIKPASDVAATSMWGGGGGAPLSLLIDDGTTFAASDHGTTYIRSAPGVADASLTVAFAPTTATGVAQVVVNYQASTLDGRGTVQVKLLDGATVIATGAAHPLSDANREAWQDLGDTFTGLAVANANTLRVQLAFHNTAGAGSLRCSTLWLAASAPSAPVSNELFHTAYPHAFVNAAGQSVRLDGVNVKRVINPADNWTHSVANYQPLKAKGFNVLRFALDWPDFETANGVFNPTAIALLKTAVANAKAAGLFVILDPIHIKGGGTNVPSWALVSGGDDIDSINQYGAAYWRFMATQFKDEANVIAYDLVNEPYARAFDQNRVLRMYAGLMTTVRAIDPDKIITIEPMWGNSGISGALADFSILPFKDNLIWQLHDYFAGGDDDGYDAAGIPRGSYVFDGTSGYPASQPAQLERYITINLDRLAQEAIPAFVGEYGLGNGVANHDLWVQQQTAIYDKYDLSRTYWSWQWDRMQIANADYSLQPWAGILLQ
jgi:hypothetical protein